MSQLVANKTQQSSMVDHSQPASVSSNLQVDVMLGLTLDPLGHSDKNSQLVFNGIDGDGILLPSTTLTNEEDDSLFSPLVCAPIQTLELLPLTDMFVPLESVAFGRFLSVEYLFLTYILCATLSSACLSPYCCCSEGNCWELSEREQQV